MLSCPQSLSCTHANAVWWARHACTHVFTATLNEEEDGDGAHPARLSRQTCHAPGQLQHLQWLCINSTTQSTLVALPRALGDKPLIARSTPPPAHCVCKCAHHRQKFRAVCSFAASPRALALFASTAPHRAHTSPNVAQEGQRQEQEQGLCKEHPPAVVQPRPGPSMAVGPGRYVCTLILTSQSPPKTMS